MQKITNSVVFERSLQIEKEKNKKEFEKQLLKKQLEKLEKMHHEEIIERFKKKRDVVDSIKKEREEIQKDFEKFYSEYIKAKPLHVIREEEFNKKMQKSFLIEREKSRELRGIRKPLKREEFENHLNWYNETKNNSNLFLPPLQIINPRLSPPKTFQENLKKFRIPIPKTSEKKQKELESLLENTISKKSHIKELKKRKEYYFGLKYKMDFLDEDKKEVLMRKIEEIEQNNEKSTREIGLSYLKNQKFNKRKNVKSNRTSEENLVLSERNDKYKYINYLRELAKENNFEKTRSKWKHYSKENNLKTKFELILPIIEKLDKEANVKEKLQRNNVFCYEKKDKLDNELDINLNYISSIKAKLELLK